MDRKWWLALVLVLSVAVVAGVSTLAQDDGGPGGGGPGGGGPGGRSGRMGGMMGGGAAMVVHGDFIYVLMGPRLIKVDPSAMKTVGELELAAPGGGPGGGGAGGKKGPGGGGEPK